MQIENLQNIVVNICVSHIDICVSQYKLWLV